MAARFEAFEDGGRTWAVAAGPLRTFGLVERRGDAWSEVVVEEVSPPDGVQFAKVIFDGFLDAGGAFAPYPPVRPSTVVIVDGRFLSIPSPNEIDSGIVTHNQFIYGTEVSSQHGSAADFSIWRSGDGITWEEVDKPEWDGVGLSFAYLTAGHERLMLTLKESADAAQEVWTSLDGTDWEKIEQEWDFTTAAPPVSTDFGWMVTTIGPGHGSTSGPFHLEEFRLLLSADGLEWESVAAPRPSRNYLDFVPSPVDYAAGLFVRRWDYMGPTTHVGRLVEGSLNP
jgi:hypothetical protein